MSMPYILSENWSDYLGAVLLGWWAELSGPYRFADVAITVVAAWPWFCALFRKKGGDKGKEGAADAQRTRPAWCTGLGFIMVFAAALAFCISRYAGR
jgi:hypothetical protein